MPIRLRDNPYQGVNPHLQSYLQSERGDWPNFHSGYLAQIRIDLDRQLPPGYLAISEKSLQISENFWLQENLKPSLSRADIMIMGEHRYSELAADVQTADLTISMAVLSDEERYSTAVVIHEVSDVGIGRPVTRIELLSPSNMPPQSGYDQYVAKREETLLAGIRLIEINFLHQFRPTLEQMPSYKDRHVKSYPYTLTVFDPLPSIEAGQIYVFGSYVDTPLPITPIPLIGSETLKFDFNAVYQEMYRTQRFAYAVVDYTELPLGFDSYSSADQERIRARMDIIRREHEGAANADPTP